MLRCGVQVGWNVTFTGKPIIQSAEADVVEVVCVETVQDSNKEEKERQPPRKVKLLQKI